MKYSLLIALAFVGTILFASCSTRDYTCTCDYTDVTGARIKDISTVNGTQTKAKSACDDHGDNLEYLVHKNVSCHI